MWHTSQYECSYLYYTFVLFSRLPHFCVAFSFEVCYNGTYNIIRQGETSMKKRLFAFIIAILIAFSIVGCTSDTSQGDTEPRNNNRDTENPTTPNNPNTESQPQRLPPANLPLEPAEMFLYNFDSEHNGIRLTAYLGELTQLRIPDEIEGLPVVGITSAVFEVGVVTDVIVPDTLVYWQWGNGNTSLVALSGELIIPHGVTRIIEIGDGLSVRNVTRVLIPDTVERIGNFAFQGFESLIRIDIPNSVTIIGDYAFKDCTSLVNIDIPDSVTTLGIRPFNGCTSIMNISIGKGLEVFFIEDFPLLTNIFVHEDNAFFTDVDGILFSKDMTILKLFPQNRAETEYIVPDGVKEVWDIGGENLTNVIIPNGVTNAGSITSANLQNITIPDSVHSLGSISKSSPWFTAQPDGVVYVGNIALAWKGEMPPDTHVTFKEGTTGIASYAFRADSERGAALVSVAFPDSLITIGSAAFLNNEGIVSIVIPEGVQMIGGGAFSGNTALTSVIIPSSVETIGRNAFNGNISLTSVIISEGVQTIGSNAFQGNKALIEIVIPKSVVEIGQLAFFECTSLINVTILNDNAEIHPEAFRYLGLYSLSDESKEHIVGINPNTSSWIR